MTPPRVAVTRRELMARLHLSAASVKRLIRRGLPMIGLRGTAKCYDLTAARRLLRAGAAVTPTLTTAMIEHLDMKSRATAAALRDLLAAVVPADAVAHVTIALLDEVAARVRALPAAWVAQCPTVEPSAVETLRARVEEIANELPITPTDRAWAVRPLGPGEAAPTLTPSKTVPEARTQYLTLKTRRLELAGRRVRRGQPMPAPAEGPAPLLDRSGVEMTFAHTASMTKVQLTGLPGFVSQRHPRGVNRGDLVLLAELVHNLLEAVAGGEPDAAP